MDKQIRELATEILQEFTNCYSEADEDCLVKMIRKYIPENAVVLTEGEYSELLLDEVEAIKRDISEYWSTQDVDIVAKELHKDGYRKLDDHAILVLRKSKCLEEKTRKETAEKFARLVEFHSVSTRDNDGIEMFTISALGLKEILHEEFGIPYDEIAKEITEGEL